MLEKHKTVGMEKWLVVAKGSGRRERLTTNKAGGKWWQEMELTVLEQQQHQQKAYVAKIKQFNLILKVCFLN